MKKRLFIMPASIIIATLVSIVTFAACAHHNKLKVSPFESEPQLDGCVWKLNVIRSKTVQYDQGQQPITLKLNAEAGTASGKSGCNQYFCNYKSDGVNRISFSEINSSKMACPEPWMKLEHEYLQALAKVDRYRMVDEHELELYQGDKLLLSFGLTIN